MTSSAFRLPVWGDLRARSDDDLMQLARDIAAHRRQVDAGSAAVAGELARRSDRSLGYEGLAQKLGARTPEKLVSQLTGVSVGEARSMVTVGGMQNTEWLSAVSERVVSGDLSVGAAAAIREGLGDPNADVDAEQLAVAAAKLADTATSSSPSEAARAARQARDDLDAQGVVDREAVLRQRRSLRLYPQPDGTLKLIAILDPENAAYVTDAFDRVTMPRRGGPRFVDSTTEQAREVAAGSDTRTIEQVQVDAFVQFIRMAAGVDHGTVFGVKAPEVRVHVRADDLHRGSGAAYAEGQAAALSITTVHRIACAGGYIPILFDDNGQSVNVGRTIRPFTTRQRIAIAARDGGCMIPDCDRPPSWTEAHHCTEWSKGGPTDLTNGISLCRHHHMWLHNTHHTITHTDNQFWLHPPHHGAPQLLASKHPLHRRPAPPEELRMTG